VPLVVAVGPISSPLFFFHRKKRREAQGQKLSCAHEPRGLVGAASAAVRLFVCESSLYLCLSIRHSTSRLRLATFVDPYFCQPLSTVELLASATTHHHVHNNARLGPSTPMIYTTPPFMAPSAAAPLLCICQQGPASQTQHAPPSQRDIKSATKVVCCLGDTATQPSRRILLV
jgi:hypothetical protein